LLVAPQNFQQIGYGQSDLQRLTPKLAPISFTGFVATIGEEVLTISTVAM